LHAEDVGWPPKKTGENINAEKFASGKVVKGDFAQVAAVEVPETSAYAAAAA